MEGYENCSREQLINEIKALKAHNVQLQNILSRTNKSPGSKPIVTSKSYDFQKCNFQHILLKFLYLGWDYHGFVTQEETTQTIEHHLFEALKKTCLIARRCDANYHRCGRTDKGVSSFSQVISIDVRSKSTKMVEEINYCNILNRVLPENIQCIAWSPVDQDFSARFDCKSRTYKYFFPKGALDIEKMETACKYLLGTHDFRNFCKMDVNNGVTEFVRTILSIDIHGFDENANGFTMYVLTITGNAFLWHQIRYVVGVLILIGQKKEEPQLILELLDVVKNPRKPDYQMASEVPLILYDCFFENVNWIYEQETLNVVSLKLEKFWTFLAVKAAMVKSMLSDLPQKTGVNYDNINNCLIPGVKPRTYVPVMKRPLCNSLEDKIKNSLKRRKTKPGPLLK